MERALVTLAAFAILATSAVAATPKQVKVRNAAYGGIGANVSTFNTQNAHASGNPPVGVAYYRIDTTRDGRVSIFHIVVNDKSRLTGAALKRLVTGHQLPADAEQVQGWKYRPGSGYCAIYKSPWLGRVLFGPYVVLYVVPARQTAAAMVSMVAACRG